MAELHPLLEVNREAIAELCRACGVDRLDVFGSVCSDRFDAERSDVDMIATFADTGPGYADRFLALAEGLESILGRRVDLLTSAPLANEILARSVARCRQVVYERARREAVA